MINIIKLSDTDRNDIFEYVSTESGISKKVIEKDFWVTVLLKILFVELKDLHPFMFKGGTSLSKCYNLIERFSEDIDISLNMENLGFPIDDFYVQPSKSKKNKFIQDLQNTGKYYIKNTIKPALEKVISEYEITGYKCEIDNNDEEVINFLYPTINISTEEYIKPSVKIEFGTKAMHSPINNIEIKSILSEYLRDRIPSLDSSINIKTLDPERTFWEKITYIHSLNNGGSDKIRAGLSRHLYDIYQLQKNGYGKNIDLLLEVTKHKINFFRSGWANYDKILAGEINLKIENKIKDLFYKDFNDMSEMFWNLTCSFEEIIEEFKNLEVNINSKLAERERIKI